MNFFFKVICLIIFLIVFNKNGYAQNKNFLSVKVYVFGKKSSFCINNNESTYLSLATVTNNQDTAISFWIMTQSWPVDNWKTNNDSVYMFFLGADANHPRVIKLDPNSSANFYFYFKKVTIKNNIEFNLGFLYFPNPGPPSLFDQNKSNVKVFWSEKIKLEDQSNYNRVEF